MKQAAPTNALDAARIGYAVYKELDDLGQYDEAWQWLVRGAVFARYRWQY